MSGAFSKVRPTEEKKKEPRFDSAARISYDYVDLVKLKEIGDGQSSRGGAARMSRRGGAK